MVQQLSKSGAKDTPLLKAGHPPAGKLTFVLLFFLFFLFLLHESTKRCCLSRLGPGQRSVRTETWSQFYHSTILPFYVLLTHSLQSHSGEIIFLFFGVISASVSLSFCSRDFTDVRLSLPSGPRCVPTD